MATAGKCVNSKLIGGRPGNKNKTNEKKQTKSIKRIKGIFRLEI